ncbi:hypothetical protein [Wolbachia endosymbiont (group E) of Neria commutata]|uniref:hypothetical protein n=1 Tax=Wolbachia endosymbiont (group E) of Neria commutata TaxID=3066149 RepID=UPI003133086F
MQCLFISKEKAKEFAKKDNKEIIKEIQTRQAIVIGFAGGVMAVSAIAAITTIILTASMPMTVGATPGIVAAGILGCAGLLGVGFACYHVPKKPPSAEMNEVGKEQHVPESEPKKGAAPGGICS